jgi:hypothetical protein
MHRIQAEEDAQRESIISGYYISPFWKNSEYEVDPARAEKRLREEQPVYALVREWCGVETVAEFDQVRDLRGEVERLRGLVKSTASWLREAGHPQKAARLLKELNDVKA